MANVAVVTFAVPPEPAETLKYTMLAPLAARAARGWCERHGYAFRDQPPPLSGRHPCWGKIPAILAALDDHEWVLWMDADAVPVAPELSLAPLIATGAALVAQWPIPWFDLIGLSHARGWRSQPVNTGVFLVRRCDWSRSLLRAAWLRSHAAMSGARWNGRGDQEAIAEELAGSPGERHIAYVPGLQRSPQQPDQPAIFAHLYGDHADFRYPAERCRAAFRRLAADPAATAVAPDRLTLLHWCAIQNLDPACPLRRGGPERFGYDAEELDRTMATILALAHAA